MLWRVEVALRDDIPDMAGRGVAQSIKRELDLDVDDVRIIKVYTLCGLDEDQAGELLEACALHDPVLHRADLIPLTKDFDWLLEVSFRPGVTDNEGRTAQETAATVLGLPPAAAAAMAVYTATQYVITGRLTRKQVERIGRELLANELIERFSVMSEDEGLSFPPREARVTGQALDEVAAIPLSRFSDHDMVDFSRTNTLALSLTEMRAIRDYYADPDMAARRTALQLPADPTDAEIEALAQTWSEHCKHKIFNARIDYTNREKHTRVVLDSLFDTCIAGPTRQIRERLGDDDFCLSVFADNAGVMRFNDRLSACIKVETHNSPSALDPYGGALTGIVGVNRDPMGTGLGANLLCNTDVFCFASPFWSGTLPPRLLHPRRVMEGVRRGVEHGGNKSGIPTVNGAIVFEDRYLGKPLVYCGTVGTMPATINGRPSHEKAAKPGDAIVMAGGRIGKDGIHGATFSSEELHEESPATAVQIGDPITQRRMYDFIIRARDAGLYNAITDNGAGGLSSSVGEMAEDPGGCRLDLALAPLKYDGLKPWEILLSEAQERMTLAVPPESLDEFLNLAREMDVEATVLGEFTNSGFFHVTYGDKPVAWLDMDFLHNGVPQMELTAVWNRPGRPKDPMPRPEATPGEVLGEILGRLNVCSKEYVIRQYDHEVQGGSAVKPLVGKALDGPADAAVYRPDLSSDEGLVVACGICPKYSDLDTYWMMACAVDEAVRNAVCVGGDIDHMAGVDNFCWCDPVKSEKTPDGEYKLAQLVRANQALAHYCLAFGVPCISGKDSMKNDYTGGGIKISIPPTVLFTVMGRIGDVTRCTTSDFKNPGDLIYVLGRTRNELGGSELASHMGYAGGDVPQVDAVSARIRYRAMRRAVSQGLVSACHDASDGGLAAALAEMCLGGRLGARVDLEALPQTGDHDDWSLLFSESASRLVVSVPAEAQAGFEALFAGQAMARVGEVTASGGFSVKNGAREVLAQDVDVLARAFTATLDW
jgi:phosphoribosylformylglycinamidine synthase